MKLHSFVPLMHCHNEIFCHSFSIFVFLAKNHDGSCYDLFLIHSGFKFSVFHFEVVSSMFLNITGSKGVGMHTGETEIKKRGVSLSGSVITGMLTFKNIFSWF